MFIFLCNGGMVEPSTMTKLVMTSNKRYAQSRLQNLFDFSLDLNIEDSRTKIALADIPHIESAFTSHSIAFNWEL